MKQTPRGLTRGELGRYLVTLPDFENRTAAYLIVDRHARQAKAAVYLGGADGFARQMLRAKREADAMCRTLNRLDSLEEVRR